MKYLAAYAILTFLILAFNHGRFIRQESDLR
jgi:hypothetical protein